MNLIKTCVDVVVMMMMRPSKLLVCVVWCAIAARPPDHTANMDHNGYLIICKLLH